MSQSNSDTFCSLPFSHMSVGPDGKLRICCNNYTLPLNPDGRSHPSLIDSDFSFETAFNSTLHRDIRKSMLKGEKHPSCFRCWEIEAGGGKSYRTMFNLSLQEKVIKDVLPQVDVDGFISKPKFFYIEMTLGNTCNLRCRMCNPWSSIQWLNEARSLNLWNADENTLTSLEKFDWFTHPKARSFVLDNLQFVDRINILGGEPLLISEHLDFLKACVVSGRSSEILVQYNSNLTRIPEGITELWKHFKAVEINSSCDAFGSLNEYIRYPIKWVNWLDNFKRLADMRSSINLKISLHTTFQTLNATRLPEFYSWAWDFMGGLALPRIPFLIYVSQPKYLDVRYLPDEFKNQILSQHQEYFDFLKGKNLTYLENLWLSMAHGHLLTMQTPEPDRDKQFQKFIDTTKAVDKSRGQSILNVLPEFEKYFK